MTNNLSDEVIKITFSLSNTVSLPQAYRCFAWVCSGYNGDEEKIILNISNYKDNLEKFNKVSQEFINLWFSKGGEYLSIYKYKQEETELEPDFNVNPNSAEIKINESFDFTIEVLKGLDLASIKVESSDVKIATAELKDNIISVTAIAVGTCNISISSSEIEKVINLDISVLENGETKIKTKLLKNNKPKKIKATLPATQLKDLDIKEGIVILAGVPHSKQLEMYKSASDEQKDEVNGKFWILSVKQSDSIDDVLKSVRGIHLMMVDESSGLDDELLDKSIFDFYAPFTKTGYYKQNSFTNSSISGLKINTLQYLKENNIGALLWWEEFSENLYYNICDTKGYTFNSNMLRKDLETKIKENGFKQLKIDNTYNQDLISMLEKIIGDSAMYFKNQNLIGSYKTSSIPFKNQDEEDIKNKVIKGFSLTYQVLLEALEIDIEVKEQIEEVAGV